MAERDRQIEREESGDVKADIGVDVGPDRQGTSVDRPSDATAAGGLRSRIRDGASTVATGRSLVVSLAFVAASALLVGGILPLGSLGNLLGVALGGFLYGVVASTRHYTETALAGTAVGGILALLGNLAVTLTGVGVPLVAVGAIGGGLTGLVGHYFGRDLRDGLTREI